MIVDMRRRQEEAEPPQKKLVRGRERARKYVDTDGGIGNKNFDIQL